MGELSEHVDDLQGQVLNHVHLGALVPEAVGEILFAPLVGDPAKNFVSDPSWSLILATNCS